MLACSNPLSIREFFANLKSNFSNRFGKKNGDVPGPVGYFVMSLVTEWTKKKQKKPGKKKKKQRKKKNKRKKK